MNKQSIKGFVVGVVLTMLLTTTVFAAGGASSIGALLNRMDVYIDGKEYTENNLLYNGRIYIPLRDVANMTGKKIILDQKGLAVFLYNTTDTTKTNLDTILNYSQAKVMESTAYYVKNGRTYTGTVCKRGTVAVDPRVIPLGSKMYIEGYGFATAEDTGGAIKGNIVDVFLESTQEARNWGRRNVKVYVLNKDNPVKQ